MKILQKKVLGTNFLVDYKELQILHKVGEGGK